MSPEWSTAIATLLTAASTAYLSKRGTANKKEVIDNVSSPASVERVNLKAGVIKSDVESLSEKVDSIKSEIIGLKIDATADRNTFYAAIQNLTVNVRNIAKQANVAWTDPVTVIPANKQTKE